MKADTSSSGVELTFYEKPKETRFNHEEFKQYAIQRLRMLRKIEIDCMDTSGIKSLSDDINSHFCMKLVSAQSKWSINWFVTQETALFRRKLMETKESARIFFEQKVWPHLNTTKDITHDTFYSQSNVNLAILTDRMKVHFTKCSDLISDRTYKLRSGYLDMCEDVLLSFLVDTFKTQLERQMAIIYEKVVIDTDERLLAINKLLFSIGDSTDVTSLGDIMKSSEFFPLCIQGILQRLKANRHLKYQDRQMLCLFFKDIRMGMNECIEFFRSNFKCTQDEFNKEYLYNIRHNYGMEGKRGNYKSFTCAKIIGFSDQLPVNFGCPFVNNHDFVRAHSDIEDLGSNAISCCKKVGEKVIKKELHEIFYSPAAYFEVLMKENENKE